MTKAIFDLSFGNSVAVRKAFLDTVPSGITFTYGSMMRMDYPVHSGDPELVKITRQVIQRQIGKGYRHVFITNGATGADVIALRAYAQKGFKVCRTRKAPYYSRFPGMIAAAGMVHWTVEDGGWNQIHDTTVLLVDLPSNPIGTFDGVGFHSGPIILDAVYYNNVYCGHEKRDSYGHNILTGSYSKLLGINGVRLGWIALDDDLLADRISKLLTAEYCGLSVPDAWIVRTYLEDLNWDNFESRANMYLNFNRTDFSKLEKFFGGVPIPKVGMFYYAPVDKLCAKLLDEAGILYTKGSLMGASDDFGRFNIGQDMGMISEAVKTILKIDKI
jgi:aspartate/methionine/tyrosine aminotransferase